MPAKWQTWWPRRIDAWHGSTFVQYSHPAARSGYADLLDRQWQSEDCTIPDDPQELSEMSGLGAELWEIHGPRILRKFEIVGPGKRRNMVLFQDWTEAKRVYESRQKSAHDTNNLRRKKAAAKRALHGDRDGDRAMTGTVSRHIDRDIVEEQKQKPSPPTPSAPQRGPDEKQDLADGTLTPMPSAGSKQESEDKGKTHPQAAGELPEGGNAGMVQAQGESRSAGTPGVKIAAKNLPVRPSKTDSRRDRLKSETKAEVLRFWERGEIPGIPEWPWSGREDRAQDAFLRDHPKMTVEEFKQLLQNRAQSEDINRADPPYKWLRSLIKYADGPLDRFGKPLKGGRRK